MSYVVNLYGGPGSGKSTLARGLHYHLTALGFSAEICEEPAKAHVWEGNLAPLGCQPYMFGEQLRRYYALRKKVEFVIFDCPLLMSLIYASPEDPDSFRQMIMDFDAGVERRSDIIVVRERGPYRQAGRVQTLSESIAMDQRIARDITPLVPAMDRYVRSEDCPKQLAVRMGHRMRSLD